MMIQTRVSTSAGFSFSSLRQAAQFDVPANKRFWEAATQQVVTQSSGICRVMPGGCTVLLGDSGACTSQVNEWQGLQIPVMRIRHGMPVFIRVGGGGLEPRTRYTEGLIYEAWGINSAVSGCALLLSMTCVASVQW